MSTTNQQVGVNSPTVEALSVFPTLIQKLDNLAAEVHETNTEVRNMRISLTNMEKWIENKEEEDKEAALMRKNMELRITTLECKLEQLQSQVDKMNKDQTQIHEQNLKLDTYS